MNLFDESEIDKSSSLEQLFNQLTSKLLDPLAVELLEIYGQTVHGDWLRFLDEEILNVLPKKEYELLAMLANSSRPITWEKLATLCEYDGKPPEQLISHGLLIELKEGLWLHEALRERLLLEVGDVQKKRKEKLDSI